MKAEKKQYIYSIIILLVLLLVVGIRIFYRLPSTSISDDDEAWHAVNAYEMYQNNTYLVNTYRGEVDYYNSKPPLAFWCTLTFFHLFGINMLTLKLSAAIAGFLTCIVCVLFLSRKYGIQVGAYFAGGFLLLYKVFDYHGFRTANLDGVYILFFTLAILTLWAAVENNIYLNLFGLWVGGAFLTKCAHVGSLVLIAILAIPLLKKNWKWKNFIGCVLACIIPIAIWMVARFQFDGTAFLYATIREIVNKTSSLPTLGYLKKAFKEPLFIILLLVLVCYYMLALLNKHQEQTKKDFLINELNETYVPWLWLLVPMITFSIAGNALDWYVYPSHIGAVVLLAVYTDKLLCLINRSEIYLVLNIVFCIIALFFGGKKIYSYRMNGHGGGYCERIQALCEELRLDYADEYNGQKIYMATPYRQEGREGINTEWYTDFIALFDIYADMRCEDGGVESFLMEEEALLVLDKDLWDSYAGILTGYYIVEDGDGYLLFYSKTYEEM